MASFTPVASLVGGLLIGLAALALMAFNGQVAGISSILSDAVAPESGGRRWRGLFLAGLLAGGVLTYAFLPGAFETTLDRSIGALIFAGLLVGFGTKLGGGCTSGHGVCGIGRLSKRSVVATITFMATGALTVFVVAHAFGGSL